MIEPTLRSASPGAWSGDDMDRLCDLLGRGQPVRDIARIIGRSAQEVRLKAAAIDRECVG